MTKLIILHDLPRSTVTNQIASSQRGLHSTPEFECAMDRRYQVLVSRLGRNLRYHHFFLTEVESVIE